MKKLIARFHSLFKASIVISIMICGPISVYSQSTKFDVELFSAPTGIESYELKNGSIDTTFVKQKTVMLNNSVSMGQIQVGNSVGFELFGEQFGSEVDKIETNINGTTTIRSRLTDYPMGFMLISATNGLSSGVIHIPELGKQYSFATKNRSGIATIGLINNATLYGNQPRCATETSENSSPTDFVQLKSSEMGLKNQNLSLGDSIVTLDVMVVYTQRILSDYLLEDIDINNVIAIQIEYMNMVMKNSKTLTKFNLVYSGGINYSFNPNTQTNYMDALTRMQDDNDGYMDELKDIRDTYHADFVVLIAEIEGAGGVSSGVNGGKSGNSELGAQIVCGPQFKHDLSLLMHEVGHNFGCGHNRYQKDNAGPKYWSDWPENTWSSGWYWIGEDEVNYRCVMSYSNSFDGKGYNEAPYFSNPQVNYKNVPTGDSQLADNARTMREMRGVIANYRKNPNINCIVTTKSVKLISGNQAICEGEVLNIGGSEVKERGVCWSTKINPTINDYKAINGFGLGKYTCYLDNLSPNTEFYVRTFATNSYGTRYGNTRVLSTGDNYIFDPITGILKISGSVTDVLPAKVLYAITKTGSTLDMLKKVEFSNISGKISINKDAFKGCSELQTIILPDSLTSIGHQAFSGCSKLQDIVLPKTLISIEEEAFQDCISLVTIQIPEKTISVGQRFVEGCTELKRIDVSPNNINYTSIDGVLFNKNKEILLTFPNANTKDYKIPQGVKTIGKFAFFRCTGITSVFFPSTVTDLEQAAFWATSNLEYYLIDPSNQIFKSIEGVLFSKNGDVLTYYPNAKSNNYEIPSGVKIIGKGAFADCFGLKTIKFPETLTSIEEYAFRICTGLNFIEFPDSLEHIGYYAFGECEELTTIILPLNIKVINQAAFWYCTKLNTIVCNSLIEPFIGSASFHTSGILPRLVFVPNATSGFNKDKWGWETTVVYGALPENTVTFDSQDGSPVNQMVVKYNDTLTTPINPLKKGYVFEGWFKENNYINKWNFQTDIVTKPITLYAKWSVFVPNQNPVAQAGADLVVNENTLVALDASLSSDPDGNPLTYKWTAPIGITLSSATAQKPTFTAPEVKKDTTYNFSLVVNDGTVDSPPSTMKVTVLNVIKVSADITESSAFKVYPNPTNSEVIIEMAVKYSGTNEISVLTMQGAVVMKKLFNHQQQFKLDLSGLADGLYFIQLQNGNQFYKAKIILQKHD